MEFKITKASDWLCQEESINFNTLEELLDYAKNCGHRLIINAQENTITIYDDYLES